MATNGSDKPAPVLEKKKARPNPARRKASKVKTQQQDVQGLQAVGQSVSNETDSKVSAHSQKSVSSKTPAPRSTESQRAAKKPSPVQKKSKPESIPTAQSIALAGVTGSLVGCVAGAAVFLGSSLWKSMAGPESAILAARSAKFCIDNLIEELITSLRAGTYNGVEALDMLRRTTLAYASAIPGGASFVERTFREIDMIRKQRGREADVVLKTASIELAKASKNGATAEELQTVVVKQLANLSSFASNASQDVLARNPVLRPVQPQAANSGPKSVSTRTPTVKVNMAIRHRPTAAA